MAAVGVRSSLCRSALKAKQVPGCSSGRASKRLSRWHPIQAKSPGADGRAQRQPRNPKLEFRTKSQLRRLPKDELEMELAGVGAVMSGTKSEMADRLFNIIVGTMESKFSDLSQGPNKAQLKKMSKPDLQREAAILGLGCEGFSKDMLVESIHQHFCTLVSTNAGPDLEFRTQAQLQRLRKDELSKELSRLGLATSGLKADLVERLYNYSISNLTSAFENASKPPTTTELRQIGMSELQREAALLGINYKGLLKDSLVVAVAQHFNKPASVATPVPKANNYGGDNALIADTDSPAGQLMLLKEKLGSLDDDAAELMKMIAEESLKRTELTEDVKLLESEVKLLSKDLQVDTDRLQGIQAAVDLLQDARDSLPNELQQKRQDAEQLIRELRATIRASEEGILGLRSKLLQVQTGLMETKQPGSGDGSMSEGRSWVEMNSLEPVPVGIGARVPSTQPEDGTSKEPAPAVGQALAVLPVAAVKEVTQLPAPSAIVQSSPITKIAPVEMQTTKIASTVRTGGWRRMREPEAVGIAVLVAASAIIGGVRSVLKSL